MTGDQESSRQQRFGSDQVRQPTRTGFEATTEPGELYELVLSDEAEVVGRPDSGRRAVRRLGVIAPGFQPSLGVSAVLALISAVLGVSGTWFGQAFSFASRLSTELSTIVAARVGDSGLAAQLRPYEIQIRDLALVHGGFALVGLVAAVAVLAAWREARHATWVRLIGQVAALVGVAGVVMSALILSGAVGGMPRGFGI